MEVITRQCSRAVETSGATGPASSPVTPRLPRPTDLHTNITELKEMWSSSRVGHLVTGTSVEPIENTISELHLEEFWIKFLINL